MAFAKLSGSLLESDARPARAPEQPLVPAPPRNEERVTSAADAQGLLDRLARLGEATPLYSSLWKFIRTGDEEGVAGVVAELVRAGRSVSEISDVVESLAKLIGSAGTEPNENPAGEVPALLEASPNSVPDEICDTETARADDNPATAWATDPVLEPEPAIGTPPHPGSDTATWQEPTRISAESAIVADAESFVGVPRTSNLLDAMRSAKPAPRSFPARAYLGIALAAVVAIAGGGAFLFGRPAVKQVGAATAIPAASATTAMSLATPSIGGITQPAADGPAARPFDAAKTALVAPPAPAPAPSVPPAPPPSMPAAAAPPESPTPPIVSPETKRAETETTQRAASTLPAQPDQSAPAVSAAALTSAPTPPDRAASDRTEASPVVASLEPPKNSPAAIAPSSPAPPVGAPVSAAVEAKDPPAMPVETAPLLERGDRLFGTGDVASARLFYERAADAGNGQAALRLGETYDPAFLQRAQLRVAGDRGLALFWYGRARELGADEADILLKGMQSR